jgi:Putative heavy-metal chelation
VASRELKRDDVLSFLKERIVVRTTAADKSIFLLTSVYRIDMTFQPNALELPFTDTILLAQSAAGTGACCCIGKLLPIDNSWIGTDVRALKTKNRCLEIALLDSAYGYLKEPPTMTFQLTGSPALKARARALLATNEVLRCLSKTRPFKRPRVALVGAVGNIVAELVWQGCEVFATDFDKAVIGYSMSGVLVEDGRIRTLERVMQSDVALVTGATLSSNTTGEIIRRAVEQNTRLIFYAQTGSNFARELIELGVDTVISERFPFYMFPGDSTVDIYRKSS